jgi:hypothetical protein
VAARTVELVRDLAHVERAAASQMRFVGIVQYNSLDQLIKSCIHISTSHLEWLAT